MGQSRIFEKHHSIRAGIWSRSWNCILIVCNKLQWSLLIINWLKAKLSSRVADPKTSRSVLWGGRIYTFKGFVPNPPHKVWPLECTSTHARNFSRHHTWPPEEESLSSRPPQPHPLHHPRELWLPPSMQYEVQIFPINVWQECSCGDSSRHSCTNMCCKISETQGQHGSTGGSASRRVPGWEARRCHCQPQEKWQVPQGNSFCLPAREVWASDRRRRKWRAEDKEEGAVQKSQEGKNFFYLTSNLCWRKGIHSHIHTEKPHSLNFSIQVQTHHELNLLIWQSTCKQCSCVSDFTWFLCLKFSIWSEANNIFFFLQIWIWMHKFELIYIYFSLSVVSTWVSWNTNVHILFSKFQV